MATNQNNNSQFVNPFQPGWPTSTHTTTTWNAMITQLNNLTGNGNAIPVTTSALVGPTPSTTTASTLTVTASQAGSALVLSNVAGVTVTLPAATGTGNTYMFAIGATTTSGAYKILAASSSDNLIGMAIGENAGTCKAFPSAHATGNHSLQMPFSGSQPSGGFEGDWFIFEDVAANTWHVRGMYQAGTATILTPFSTATS